MQFHEHIQFLSRAMQPVSLDVVVRAIQRGTQLPENAVLVTFDDGDRTVLEHAAPVMKALGVPGVVFVIAGLLDSDTPFWWDEVKALVESGGTCDAFPEHSSPSEAVTLLKRISNVRRLEALDSLRRTAARPAPRREQLRRSELRELEAHGIAIGNHTLSHPCLNQCDAAHIGVELEASQEILTKALGHRPSALAYPNGDEDPRVRKAAEVCGFEAAFLFDHRKAIFPVNDSLRVSRLRVNSTTSMDRFKIILSGLHPAIHHAIGRN